MLIRLDWPDHLAWDKLTRDGRLGIQTPAGVVRLVAERADPDIGDAQKRLNEIVEACHHAWEGLHLPGRIQEAVLTQLLLEELKRHIFARPVPLPEA